MRRTLSNTNKPFPSKLGRRRPHPDGRRRGPPPLAIADSLPASLDLARPRGEIPHPLLFVLVQEPHGTVVGIIFPVILWRHSGETAAGRRPSPHSAAALPWSSLLAVRFDLCGSD